MGKWFKFWANNFKWAYWRWESREAIITLSAPAIISIVTWLLTIFGFVGFIQVIRGNILWWLALVPFVVMVFLVAPYYRWKEQKDKVELLEERAKPLLKVKGVVQTNIRGAKRSWGLRIVNQGTNRADNAKGEIIYLEFTVPSGSLSMRRWPVYQPLHWAQAPIGTPSIDIPGSREAILEVIITELDNMWIAYSLSEDFRENHKITIDDNFTVGIALTSQDALPTYIVVFIAKGAFGGLVTPMLLLEVTEKKPVEHDYRQILDKHKEEIEQKVNALMYPETDTDYHIS